MVRMICAAVAATFVAVSAHAQLKVGLTLSLTGPAASLGIPEKNTVDLMPKKIGGLDVTYIVLDDASDTTKAVTNTKKLITEDKVDIIIGSTTTPNSMAMIDVVADGETPNISLGGSARIVDIANPKTKWVFKVSQHDSLMADAIAVHAKAGGITSIGFIGYNDAYGEGWLVEMRRSAATAGIKMDTVERFNRTDASTTGQTLKLMAANPQAILIVGSGTPAATPHKELIARGYKGRIYQTHGVGNSDFLRVVGKDGNGSFLPAGPMLSYESLPDSNPIKKVAKDYITQYEAKFGPRTTFGGHAWDAYIVLNNAIPEALKSGAKPGSKEFRAALRTAMENTKEVVGVHGVFNMSATEHNGLDNRGRTMFTIKDGKWALATK
jgi:branched-chain amino acid transport system substrate-binding protein